MTRREPPDIPFNRPRAVGRELEYIAQAVAIEHLAGDGGFTRKCSEWMEERFSATRVLLTHSCTGALEMAALLCDIGPSDEVIMPSFTFPSTANAFVLRGAKIRFVDIRPDTLNIDEGLIEASLGPRSKVVVPVHYAGIAAEMDSITGIASQHGLVVVEDAAHGVGATFKGKHLGTIGDLGAFSFHETKAFISGEGGALVVNDERWVERAEIVREKGTDRSRFFRGEVDEYTWVDVGSSYLPSEIIAAFLFAQLEEADSIAAARREVFDRYQELLGPFEEGGVLRLPVCPSYCRHNAHQFHIVLGNEKERDGLIRYLQGRGIQAVFHYLPLHTSPMGRRMGYEDGQLPVTEDMSRRLLRLPFYIGMTAADQERVVGEIGAWFNGR